MEIVNINNKLKNNDKNDFEELKLMLRGEKEPYCQGVREEGAKALFCV